MKRHTLAHSLVALAACVALGACNASAKPSADTTNLCFPSAELQDRAGIDARDCGTFSANTATDTLVAAQRCVLDAIEGGEAFRTWVQMRGIDSALGEGFASDGGPNATLFQLSYSTSAPGGTDLGASLSVDSCRELTVIPACEIIAGGGLCLGCNETLDTDQVCTLQSQE